ncbi:hypothetical protein Droror1_Dr00018052 [Drosera rotundifolia]
MVLLQCSHELVQKFVVFLSSSSSLLESKVELIIQQLLHHHHYLLPCRLNIVEGTESMFEKRTSALKSLGNMPLASHSTSTSSQVSIKILDLMKAVWNIILNIISSLTKSSPQ